MPYCLIEGPYCLFKSMCIPNMRLGGLQEENARETRAHTLAAAAAYASPGAHAHAEQRTHHAGVASAVEEAVEGGGGVALLRGQGAEAQCCICFDTVTATGTTTACDEQSQACVISTKVLAYQYKRTNTDAEGAARCRRVLGYGALSERILCVVCAWGDTCCHRYAHVCSRMLTHADIC